MSSNGTAPEQIAADIARQREQLATDVRELQARLDVRSRAQHRVAELKQRATTATGRPRPELTVVAALAVVVGLALWRRRH